jgi:molybdate transport system ATP-binding protein
VSLSLDAYSRTSILNRLAATVVDLADTDKPGHVLVRLDMGGSPLLARITRRSALLLGIRPGLPVVAQIKSVALLA